MREKSIGKNYIYNLINQVVNVLFPLLVTPYISRVLGAEAIGEYSFVNAIISFWTLFAGLGTVVYGRREIAYCNGNRKMRSKIFWEVEGISIINTLMVFGLYILFLFFESKYRVLFLIASLQLISVVFDISWLFFGNEDFSFASIVVSMVKTISLIFIFGLVKAENDLWKYALIIYGGNLICYLFMWIRASKYVDYYIPKISNMLSHFQKILKLFIPTIAINIYVYIDRIMLGICSPDIAQNAYYDQSQNLIKILLAIVCSLGIVLGPRIEGLYQKKQKEEIIKLVYIGAKYIWLTAIPMGVGIISIVKIFVPIFFGPGYEQIIVLIYIFTVLLISIGFSNLLSYQYLIPTQQQGVFTKTIIVALIINVFLNGILIPFYGAVGAAIASVISETSISIGELFFLSKDFDCIEIFKSSKNYWMAGIIMYIWLFIEKKWMETGITDLIILILTGIMVYFSVLLILRDEFLILIIKKIGGKFMHNIWKF